VPISEAEAQTVTINQSNSTAQSDLWQLLQAAEGNQTSAVSSSTQASTAVSDSSSVSDPGKLIKELEQLSKTNPAEFKKIAASIASQLTAAAKNSSDPSQAQALTTLASDFTQASQSGNLSALFSSQGTTQNSRRAETDATSAAYASTSSNPIEEIFAQALSQIQSDSNTTVSTS
jgi:hypothetical protein